MSRVQQTSQRVFGTLWPHLPAAVKRPLWRASPRGIRRYVDRDWYRHTMGKTSSWETLGRLQFDFLVGQGLLPENYLLDVGCGPLRAGIHFIRYLEPEHYFGIDHDADLFEAAREAELPRHGLEAKRPVLVQMENFDFVRLRQKFDYALAQSVFTHLSINKIIRCLLNMEGVLVPGGRFYATIYLNERGKQNLDPIEQQPGIFTLFDKNPFHYDFATFEWICEGTSLTPEYLGDWDSPRNQKMLVFTKG